MGSRAARRLAAIAMEACGYDVILYETVGVGQGEVEVASAADTVVLCLQPGAGDAVQALKAGVMEIADVFCINKADNPQAKNAASEVRSILEIGQELDPDPWFPPIVMTRGDTGEGVKELKETIQKHRDFLQENGRLARDGGPPSGTSSSRGPRTVWRKRCTSAWTGRIRSSSRRSTRGSWIPSRPRRSSSRKSRPLAPERIVSLVPSLTETLFALGVGERVVGRTRYCTQPPRAVGRVPKVGGTKKIDVGRVLELDPDLVVAVKEENSRENVEALAEARASPSSSARRRRSRGASGCSGSWPQGSRPRRTEHVLAPIERVVQRLEARRGRTRRVFVPIWKSPYMGVGSDTYVHDVLEVSGGENICGGATRYPVVTLQEIEALHPEVVLLPDEPYPFSAEDLPEFYALDIPAAREDRIHLVDGKLLTWYGPRMAGSLTQISALLRS